MKELTEEKQPAPVEALQAPPPIDEDEQDREESDQEDEVPNIDKEIVSGESEGSCIPAKPYSHEKGSELH